VAPQIVDRRCSSIVLDCAPGTGRNPELASHLVVTYHYVRERNSDGVTGITPAEFDAQIRAIKARFRVVGAAEFVELRASERNLALITFDDGLRDQWRAASILDAHDVPAVFYVPMRPYSDCADRWCTQHLLHALAERLGWDELERRIAPQVEGVAIDTAAMNRLYHYEVPQKRRLKYALAFALPQTRTAEVLREINSRVGLRADDWYLTVAQLRGLEDAGHALGGHGFDHVPYDTLSPKAQAADLHRAVRTMNLLCGAMPRTLAYPFGRHTPVTEALARGCGYTFAFTTDNRVDAKFVPDELARREAGSGP
jgi:peptidoglycan/xylan/chitin deacetylase (PgdA/CDA1 family)